MSDGSSSLKLSSEATSEQFTAKMQDIALKAKEEEAQARAATLGLPYINLHRVPITPEALSLIPREKTQSLQVVCFLYTGPAIRLGAVDPGQPEITELLHQLEERHHSQALVYVISEKSLKAALAIYDKLPLIKKRSRNIVINEEDLKKFSQAINSVNQLSEQIKKASVTDVLTILMAAALNFEASDMHIEAEEKNIVVRFRLDGVLNNVADLSKEIWPKLISRLKLMAGLKINITDRPQDGRFTIAQMEQKFDVRVSAVPTVFGESVVIRFLKPMAAVQFDNLGVRGQTLTELQRQVERPNGMIAVTGPTGSGKTTTLYAILKKLNKPGAKIITLEDPVEYKLEGINQSQIDPSHDYTFAKGLRSILRQDPDVVMVGEIRDLETAETAIQAALTGHLMLSTIHTNSAAGAIPRFLSMGVKPFLLAPALNAVIGQRLVRKLCPKCKKEIRLEESTLKKIKEILTALPPSFRTRDNLKFYQSAGCEFCQKLGYKGRTGIYEIMIMNKEIEQLILKNEISEYIIQEIAVKNGMVTMVQDGLLKALDGITSVEEVFRVAE